MTLGNISQKNTAVNGRDTLPCQPGGEARQVSGGRSARSGAARLGRQGHLQCARRTTPARLRRGVFWTLSYEPAAISLSEKAFVTAWRELVAPSLRLTFERWKTTVRSEICSAWPISKVVLPLADWIKHWLSRSLRTLLRAPSIRRSGPAQSPPRRVMRAAV